MNDFLQAALHPVALLGFCGQFAFLGRFVVQWVASEKARRSVIPPAFWYLSIAGALLLLVYAWLRRDPVFLLGQLAALGIYARNLVLIRRSTEAPAP